VIYIHITQGEISSSVFYYKLVENIKSEGNKSMRTGGLRREVSKSS
jgi:hypothetical protein